MTYMGLAWYDRIENGEHLVNPIAWESDHLSPQFNASVATRAQVEEKIKEMGWMPTYRNYGFSHNKNIYFLMSFNNTDFIVKLEDSISSQDFDTAPAQLAEAIQVARLLNATKELLK